MKIHYFTLNGNTVDVEVNENVADISDKINRDIKNNNRRETRRHTSFDQLSKQCNTEIADNTIDIEADYINREEIEILRAALKSLNSDQLKIINKIFYQNQSLKKVAKDYGVSYQAIQNRLNKIINKLKKKFY